MEEKIQKLINEWHEAGRASFEARYQNLVYDRDCPKRFVIKRKYVCLDEGSGGAFLLEKATGNIYRIKSKYGVPNRKKLVGHIDTITGDDLNKYRWY